MAAIPTGKCAVCGYRKRINKDGNVYGHRIPEPDGVINPVVCPGSGDEPVEGTVRNPATPLYSVEIADVDYAAGWLDRHLWHLTVAALVVAGAALGFAIGVGVEGGWHW